MSLLKSDKELVKQFNLSEAHELSRDEKIEFVNTQIDSIKATLWRSRVDLILNRNITAEGKAEKQQVEEKIREHENNVERFAEAVTILDKLKSEL